MKLLFFTSSFILNSGGISSYAHDFVDAYKNIYSIAVVTSDNYKQKQNDKFETFNFDLFDLSRINASKILNYIEIEDPDIIINSNAPIISALSPFISNQVKLITVSHFVNGRLAIIAGFNARYVNNVIALSNYGKSYIKKRFNIKDKSKISIVYNFMPPKESSEIFELKKSNKPLIIVYPGGASIHKSPDIVLQIVKRLIETDYDFIFYWIGGTILPGHKFKFLKVSDIKQLVKNDKRLIFTGKIPRVEAINIIENANIFLLPSRGEGCPISLLESIRTGSIPIISDSNHGSKEIIEHMKSGFILPLNDIDSYYNKIIAILDNHNIYFEYYDNSKNRFENFLNKNIWTHKMNSILNDNEEHISRKKFSTYKYYLSSIKLKTILISDRMTVLIRSLRYMIYFNSQSVFK